MGTAIERAAQGPRRLRRSSRRSTTTPPTPPTTTTTPPHLHTEHVGARDAEPECPVCMSPYAPGGGARFAFPCGHCVCAPCNVRLRDAGYLACPTCREPRAGVCRAQVDAASAARVRRDELREQHAARGEEATLTVAHNGSVYELLFFPDQASEERPYDVLRTVHPYGVVPSAFSRVRVGEHWLEAGDAEAGDAEAGDAERRRRARAGARRRAPRGAAWPSSAHGARAAAPAPPARVFAAARRAHGAPAAPNGRRWAVTLLLFFKKKDCFERLATNRAFPRRGDAAARVRRRVHHARRMALAASASRASKGCPPR